MQRISPGEPFPHFCFERTKGLSAERGSAMTRVALVVEDERDTGLILGEHLRRWGFEPTVLAEGKPAISWVRDNKPELVLLDVLLPDMLGFEVCETLKLDRETNLIPIIMI